MRAGRAAWLSTGDVIQKPVATTAAVAKAMEMSLRILVVCTGRNANAETQRTPEGWRAQRKAKNR